ncbi:putative ribonuclease H-like domain-containing protein [Tanacetum coccineum]
MSGEEPATQIAPVESPQMVSTIKLPILKKGEYTLWSGMSAIISLTDYSCGTLPSSWNNVALIMRNKDGIDDLDIDDLYNNLKVFEADIKGSSGSSLNSQNVTFISAEDTSSSNEVNTTNGGSTASGHNSQRQASSSSYTDDLMVKRFYKKTGRKLIFNGKEPVGFDKTKDNTRRIVPVETSAAFVIQDNALIVQDGMGYDWSYIAQDELTEFALMAYTANSSGPDIEANLEIVAYPLGLEFVEAQLIVHQKNEVVFEEKIAVFEFEVKDKSNAITRLKNQLDETLRKKDYLKAKLEQFETSSKNLNKLINSQLSAKDKTGLGYGDQLNENDSSGSELFNSVFDSRSSDRDDNQTNDRFKKDNGYHDVPPPLTGNYMPSLADLSFAGLDDSVYRPTANKTSASVSQVKASTSQTSNTSVEMPRVESVRPSGVIIEDWVSDDEDIFQSNDLQATDKPSFKRVEFSDARNESIKPKQAKKPRMITQNPKVDRRDWNGQMTQKLGLGFGFTKKACFVCGSYSHLIKDCDFYEKRMANKSVLKNIGKNTGQREIRPVWNSAQRINYQNKFVSSAVLTRFGRVPVSATKQSSLRATTSTSTFRPVNTATHTNRVNVSKLRTNAFHKSHSPIRRPFYKSTTPNTRISNEKVNTVRVNGVNTAVQTAVSAVKETGVTAVKASAGCVWRPKMTDLNNVSKDNSGSWVSKRGNPQQALKNKGIFDSGCSRHMTGNKDFLTDYQDIDGGFVAFGGSARGGKITGKGKIRTDKLDFEDVFFLLDESQQLLRVPRQSNMYNFDLRNVVPSGDLTCLFANAIIDESKLWHRRMGHVNFKTMNKLVKGNLDYASRLPTVFWAEAVNTACYVLNRVLVTKPHNKTPYELIFGRPPSISFMRPFGCPVTILNTLDPLGKFDGKAEEGFLVGYSVNSKAFRVFNSQTKKVEENLHVNFLENKPNVAGQGPNWLFDIDSLTNFMNYQPVTAGNQTNKNAGPQETNGNTCLKKNVDAEQSEEKNVSTQQYIMFLLWSSISSSNKSSDEIDEDDTADDAAGETPVQKPASENEQALKNVLDKMMDQEKEAKEQSDTIRKDTPVNAVGAPRTSNDAGPSFVPLDGSFLDDPLMPNLEDTAEVQNTGIFGGAYDDDDLDTYNSPYVDQVMGAEADFNNMEPSTVVSPIPSTIVHSIHPKDQIIRDPRSAVQTRGMTKKSSREHAMISYIQKQRRTNQKDFQNCLFAYFLSQQEPTKIAQALDDESWVEAMQEEMLQFKIQKVWTLVDLPYGKKAIGTKWVYRNKKDERGIIVRNKARLVAQGYKQEE